MQFLQKQKKQTFSIWPALIAILLIITISGIFYLKKISRDKEGLEKKLEEKLQQEKDENLQVPLISPAEVSKNTRSENFQLIDIREADEFVLKHIEASINIPLSALEEKMHLLSKTKTVIIIDRENSSKGKVFTEHLINEGLTANYLDGGILNYAKNGYNLVTLGNPLIQSDLLKVTSYTAKEVVDQLINGARMKIVDTRSNVEFAFDHIEGSINVPLEDLEKNKNKLPIRTFLVLDKDPIRSFQAAVRLYDMNIIGVYNCKDSYRDMKEAIENAGKNEKLN